MKRRQISVLLLIVLTFHGYNAENMLNNLMNAVFNFGRPKISDMPKKISNSRKSPIVSTLSGDVQGLALTSVLSQEYFAFFGIPYAQPPIGTLRFKDPVPTNNWAGILEAFNQESQCIQQKNFVINGSEDCLYLNIYTPQLPNDQTELKPVMFWIHGGAFVGGSSKMEVYGPDFLLQHDVIVVTINYRLGAFGFLSDQTTELPGNAGLKDQILALKWVHKNINAFGGDPDKITIFGESAGGASVHYLVLSPLTKGLFRNAISESGSALAPWAFNYQPKRILEEIGKNLHKDISNTTKLVSDLQKLSSKKIQETAFSSIPLADINTLNHLVYAPCVEPKHDGAVITRNPLEIIEKNEMNLVPYLMGINSREGLAADMVAHSILVRTFVTTYLNLLMPTNCYATLNKAQMKSLQKEVKQYYFPRSLVIPEAASIDLVSDQNFIYPAGVTALGHSKNSPVYFYVFSFENETAPFKFSVGDETGVPHAGEIPYLWNMDSISHNADSMKITNQFTKLLTNFAKFGNPTPEPDPLLENKTWPLQKSRTLDNIDYIDIGKTIQVSNGPFKDAMLFWQNIWTKYCL